MNLSQGNPNEVLSMFSAAAALVEEDKVRDLVVIVNLSQGNPNEALSMFSAAAAALVEEDKVSEVAVDDGDDDDDDDDED